MPEQSLKKCVDCEEKKPLDAFHRDRKLPDGRRRRCAPCTSAARKRAYAENPSLFGEVSRRWKRKNIAKRDAHRKVQYAVARGRLIRPEVCEDCGSQVPLHAHHEDYSRVLEVDWLCPQCHRNRHTTQKDEKP